MARWKRLLLGAGAGGVAVTLTLVGLVGWTFSGMGAIEHGRALPGGARVVRDGYVSVVVLDAGDGRVALIDAGNDPDGAAILAALAERGIGPEQVSTLLLTHGHPDHVAACHRFPNATTYALADELPMLRGEVGAKSPLTRWFPPKPSGCAKLVGVADGEQVALGARSARAHAVTGHTGGSAAWQVDGVLYLGDSADVAADGRLLGAKWIFTDDPAANRASLRALAAATAKDELTTLVFSHSGVADASALRIWAAAQR